LEPSNEHSFVGSHGRSQHRHVGHVRRRHPGVGHVPASQGGQQPAPPSAVVRISWDWSDPRHLAATLRAQHVMVAAPAIPTQARDETIRALGDWALPVFAACCTLYAMGRGWRDEDDALVAPGDPSGAEGYSPATGDCSA
jgi:hypothetical protein